MKPTPTTPTSSPVKVLLSLWALWAFVLIAAFACTTHLRAQDTRGILQGTVVDAGDAAVPGAQLQLTPLNIKAVTDGQGTFRIPNVPAGSYTLPVTYVGFAPATSTVDIAAGQTATANLQLKIANAAEDIIVSASRPHGEAEAI